MTIADEERIDAGLIARLAEQMRDHQWDVTCCASERGKELFRRSMTAYRLLADKMAEAAKKLADDAGAAA